jgi:hypothetical protein
MVGDERPSDWLRRSPCLTVPSPELVVVANSACAMQPARCGHRAGISRSFRETSATRFPNLRQHDIARGTFHENSAK